MRTIAMLTLAAAMSVPLVGSAVQTGAKPRVYGVRPFLTDLSFDRPYKVLPAADGLAVLDRGNHRILWVGKGNERRQIGRIGQGTNELYHPANYAVGPGGKLYVTMLARPFEVKVLDLAGRRVGGFRMGKTRDEVKAALSLDLAVGGDGTVYLSQPYESGLITAYDDDGRRLRSFGSKVRAVDLWPEACRTRPLCNDPRLAAALNRVRLETGAKGVVAAFDRAPLLRFYDTAGKLELERVLGGEAVAEIGRRQWESPETWMDLHSYNYDGLQLPVLVNDVAVDDTRGAVWVLVGGREIHRYTTAGQLVEVRAPSPGAVESRFGSLTVGRAGELYLTSSSGVYQVRLD